MNQTVTIVLLLFSSIMFSCKTEDEAGPASSLYRDYMRALIQEIGLIARQTNKDFILIPQNGGELVLLNIEGVDSPAIAYISAIQGLGREDLWYGYEKDDKPTPSNESAEMLGYLSVAQAFQLSILVTDYCSSTNNVQKALSLNAKNGFLSFPSPSRELDLIPVFNPLAGENNRIITTLKDAKNFLYILNLDRYPTKAAFIAAVQASNYDVLITDVFHQEEGIFLPSDIEKLRKKKNGGRRLVIAYMSIGEAESYRYYWQSGWKKGNPVWLLDENPDWEGNFKVKYWDPEWQKLLIRSSDSYLSRILAADFDGAYLDLVDAFEYFE